MCCDQRDKRDMYIVFFFVCGYTTRETIMETNQLIAIVKLQIFDGNMYQKLIHLLVRNYNHNFDLPSLDHLSDSYAKVIDI